MGIGRDCGGVRVGNLSLGGSGEEVERVDAEAQFLTDLRG